MRAHLQHIYARETGLTNSAVTLAAASLVLFGFLMEGAPCPGARCDIDESGASLMAFQFLPLLPLALFNIGVYLVLQMNLLGAYTRNVERNVEVQQRFRAHGTSKAVSHGVPSIARLSHFLFAGGRGLRPLRVVYLGVTLGSATSLLGLSARSAWTSVMAARQGLKPGGDLAGGEWWWLWGLPVFYVSLACWSVFCILLTRSRAGTYQRLAARLHAAEQVDEAGTTRENLARENVGPWIRYLLLPKGSSLTKCLWGVGGAVATAASLRGAGSFGDHLRLFGSALGAAVAYEFVLGQGRFIVNDTRDLDWDVKGTHLRFPPPHGVGEAAVALLTVAVRGFAFTVVAAIVAGPWRALVVTGSFVALTVAYEAIRDTGRRAASAQKANAPPTPMKQGMYRMLLAVVGMGYGLRFVVPFVLATAVSPSEALLPVSLAFTATSVAGAAVVWGGWLKEVTQFVYSPTQPKNAREHVARVEGSGEKHKPIEIVGTHHAVSNALAAKSHLVVVGQRRKLLAKEDLAVVSFDHEIDSPWVLSPWGRDRVSGTELLAIRLLPAIGLVGAALLLDPPGSSRSWPLYLAAGGLTAFVQSLGAFSGTRKDDVDNRAKLRAIVTAGAQWPGKVGLNVGLWLIGPGLAKPWRDRKLGRKEPTGTAATSGEP